IGQKYLQSLRAKGSNHNPSELLAAALVPSGTLRERYYFISLPSIWLTPRNAYAMTLCNYTQND
ncbi:hypothetical protein QHH11_08460, partial [Aphanizomenon sp. PH219]|nr:hypothetical protein [Aphanizomenon sp. PH219]